MKGLRLTGLIVLLMLSARSGFAQYFEYPFQISHYDFINYDSSRIEYPGGRGALDRFYKRLAEVVLEGKGQVNIVQIGGSHIQADMMSGELRNRFQSFEGGQNAGRGFVFPYRLARTNTPYGYHFEYSGKWTTCRNVEKKRQCRLGMAGISAYTTDSAASLAVCFEPENDIKYHFNALKVYHDTGPGMFAVRIDSNLLDTMWVDTLGGFTQIVLKDYMDSLGMQFVKTDSLQKGFMLYGINLETGEPGIVFHNLGINGAATASFLRCQLLSLQLAGLKPDLVILGLGINDAYGKNFSQREYERNYDLLVREIRKANPDVCILYTTNNDSYIRRRYLNRNGIKVQQSMKRLAKKQDAALWDMFEVMGGLNSIVRWQRYGLAKADRIHFTRPGYLLMGDLIFDALIRDFGDYLQRQYNSDEQANLLNPKTGKPR
jgi:lysophospholipase L1-like esterase